MEFRDYYETLGVAKTATGAEIKRAFRDLARMYHPDVAKDKSKAEEKFKQINEAYEVLSDPEKRSRYDQLGANWNQTSPGGAGGFRQQSGNGQSEPYEYHFGGTGFSDFFEQFFGGGRGGFRSGSPFEDVTDRNAGREFERAGYDLESDILITLRDVLDGSIRSVSFQQRDPRNGQVTQHQFRVKIPPGVREGQRIRVAGKGGAGVSGGRPGDLFLRVRFARHPDFQPRGRDLYGTLNIAPWEAVLGAKAEVATLDGSVSLKFPPGTASGGKLRVRGHGLVDSAGQRGDLILTTVIQVPTNLKPDERALWEQLGQQSTFNPRNPT